MQRFWKTASMNAVQCLVGYNRAFQRVWSEIIGRITNCGKHDDWRRLRFSEHHRAFVTAIDLRCLE